MLEYMIRQAIAGVIISPILTLLSGTDTLGDLRVSMIAITDLGPAN